MWLSRSFLIKVAHCQSPRTQVAVCTQLLVSAVLSWASQGLPALPAALTMGRAPCPAGTPTLPLSCCHATYSGVSALSALNQAPGPTLEMRKQLWGARPAPSP